VIDASSLNTLIPVKDTTAERLDGITYIFKAKSTVLLYETVTPPNDIVTV